MIVEQIKKWMVDRRAGVAGMVLFYSIFLLLACHLPQEPPMLAEPVPEKGKPVKITFYYSGISKGLTRDIPVPANAPWLIQIQTVVNHMYLAAAKLQVYWPKELQVRSIYFRPKRKMLILDFEKSVQYNQAIDVYTEEKIIFSILQTLAENFKDIQRVKFLIGGQETETLAGHIDISRPFPLKASRSIDDSP